jgi:iron complex outermembrane receptor protein
MYQSATLVKKRGLGRNAAQAIRPKTQSAGSIGRDKEPSPELDWKLAVAKFDGVEDASDGLACRVNAQRGRDRMKKILLASTALVFCASWAGAVSAQTGAPDTDTGAGQIETVVITAEKRSERLQDAPVAVSVVGTNALQANNATDISDINKIVPSVQLNGTINGRVPLAVRGISSDSNEAAVGLSSGVEILIDGVPVPSDSYAGNQLEDVTGIEVLKGPQSTLGGRTASAGELNIITHKPSDVWTGSVDATVTNDNEEHLQGFVGGPLSDTTSFSLTGWGHNTQYPIQNLNNGKYVEVESYGARGKVRFQLSNNFDATIAAHYSEMKSTGMNFVYSYVTPGANLLCGFACPPGWPLTQAALFPNVTPSMDNQKYNSPVHNSGAIARDADVTLTLDYSFGDGYTLSSTTNYQHENQVNVQDLFTVGKFWFNYLTSGGACDGLTVCAAGYPFNDTQTQTEKIDQTMEEIKLLSPADRAFSYIIGAFYSDTKVNQTYYRNLPPALENLRGIPDTATYDLYGRATWKVLEKTTLIAGLRFNYDDLSYYDNQIAYAGTNSCSNCSVDVSDSSTALVGDITVQQQLAPHSMAYFKYSRGYAPKAYNAAAWLTLSDPANPSSAPVKPQPVAQEHIDSFELGSKGTYLDGTLGLNVAAFDTIYKDFQIQVFSNVAGVINPPLILEAAGEAETKGLEADVLLAPTDKLTVSFNAAYIDAVFNKYQGAPCWVGQSAAQGCATHPDGSMTQNDSGKTMPNSPKFKFNISATQMVSLGDSSPFDLALSGNYTYRTSAQMLADQNPHAIQPAFGIANLSVGLVSKDGNYSITAFVNNVADQHYFVDMEDFWASPWASNAVIGQPARDAHRFVGIRFDSNF